MSVIEAEIKGTVVALTLEERVPIDPAAYQLEAGWWAYTNSGEQYFVSDDGVVYAQSPKTSPDALDAFDLDCGRVVKEPLVCSVCGKDHEPVDCPALDTMETI